MSLSVPTMGGEKNIRLEIVACPDCGLPVELSVRDGRLVLCYDIVEWAKYCCSVALGSPSVCLAAHHQTSATIASLLTAQVR